MSKDDVPAPLVPTAALSDAYDKVSERVTLAYASAREAASGAAKSTASGIESNPLAALVGGIVLGTVAGALIPRGTRERELLAPAGARIGEAARAAFDAGKAAGADAFAEAGLGGDDLRAQASRLVEQALSAAGAAGTAAVSAARDAARR